MKVKSEMNVAKTSPIFNIRNDRSKVLETPDRYKKIRDYQATNRIVRNGDYTLDEACERSLS